MYIYIWRITIHMSLYCRLYLSQPLAPPPPAARARRLPPAVPPTRHAPDVVRLGRTPWNSWDFMGISKINKGKISFLGASPNL